MSDRTLKALKGEGQKLSRDDLPSGAQPRDDRIMQPDQGNGHVARLGLVFMRFRSQLTNLTAFSIIQVVSYMIPVVTIPYFARTLGIAGMGQLAIAGAAALAAGVLMDYAIQLSGTRFAASHSGDHAAISRYLSTTTFLKLAILGPILLGLCLAALVLEPVGAHFWVFFWSLLAIVMICLFPQWLFQGMLIMPVAARFLVTCRVGAAVAAMLLVRTPDDAFMVPATQAVGGILALLAASRALHRRFGIVLQRTSTDQVKEVLRENWTLFSATAWGAIYAHGGVIIMSSMLSVTSIGFYSIAQKVSQAIVSIYNVAAQTGFPSFVRSYADTPKKLNMQVRLYMILVASAAAVTLITIFILREQIYLFFSGKQKDIGLEVFSIWLLASFFTILSVSLNPVMIVLQLDAPMATVYRITGLSFLVAAPIACMYFGVVGMAVAMLVIEATIAIFFATSVLRGLGLVQRAAA